jgi:hypothetical protein
MAQASGLRRKHRARWATKTSAAREDPSPPWISNKLTSYSDRPCNMVRRVAPNRSQIIYGRLGRPPDTV